HYLPATPYPIVGRVQEIADILEYLPSTHLLTLTGSGGTGKTRLALEVGRLALHHYADGVWFISLAALHSASAIATTIAATMGLTLHGSEPDAALCQQLRQKQLLLILDNFEHLLGEENAVNLVVALLAAAPGVHMLVTSRARLKVRGEQLYPLSALPFSPAASLAEAAAAPAVQLFAQALQRIHTNFQLTTTNLAAVLRICQLVEGMPLGLELAAANARSVPLTAIADAIEESVEFLGVDWHDLPERQRSMRAVFVWSWQLLSAAEQRVLRQSAIFCGGFDYTAVQAVIDATPALLTALVDKSLLQWQAAASGEGRYTMHELLRQFAAEALVDSGEHAEVAEEQGRYYLAYLAARGFRLGRSEPKEAGAELQVELENIRLAWQWAANHGGLAELDQALYAWWQFCQLQGLDREARQSLAGALTGVRAQLTRLTEDAALRLLGTQLLAKVLALHANYLFAQGHDAAMAAEAREAIELGVASGGFEGEILGSYVLGRVLQDADQKREAQVLWKQTLQLIQRYQPQQSQNELLHEVQWMTHMMLRGSALHFGDYAGSRAHIVEALRICQTLDKQLGELNCLSCLAEINFFLFDFAAAERYYRAELALEQRLGYLWSAISAQEGLARVARLRGDYTMARTLLEESLTTATELTLHYDVALWLAALSRLHCQLGDQPAAAACQARLTQLLAQVKLAKECQLYGYLAAAVMAHHAGDHQAALAAAEEADRINGQGGDILFRLVDTALILGHVRAAVGQWEAAQSAFQEALTAFQQFGDTPGAQAVAAEAQAGLAQIALAQGDVVGAQAQIEALLPVLATEAHAGYNDPFFIYLIGYRVLAANGDPRAATLLQQGYDLLQQDAAQLDEESRQRFLTGVTIHRDLVAAYAEMTVTGTEKIRDTRHETGEGFTFPVPVALSTVPLSSVALPPVSHSPIYDWAEMPVVDFFVERKAEMAQLVAWLTPTADGRTPAQLISILGMGGMGKTTLAAMVTKAVAPTFAVVIWRSLLNAPPFDQLLSSWLHLLARQRLTTIPDTVDEQLRLLLTYLHQERCLLVLDNVESIFATADPSGRAGATRPDYEGYDRLFHQLASTGHQSCVLLTSREQPDALARLLLGRGRQAQEMGRIRVFALPGLNHQAACQLLVTNGLNIDQQGVTQLVENYSGNPLALQIVAGAIADFFGGDITAFQQEAEGIFDGIRLVLDQQFTRLSALERDILVWLAIEREAITVPTLRNNLLSPIGMGQLLEALHSLQNRSFLEPRGAGLTLQNVIIEYTTEYLVEQVCQEIAADLLTKWQETRNEPRSVEPTHPVVHSFLNRFALIQAHAKTYVALSDLRGLTG
ncbi:MAG TPA: NB-ARC domain-containing protein, partial [Caldilineaceae bacterium]|nr:NB-ARC domain-containing protein [Caldilineaceae bacterium]